mgnify:FL=1
MQFEFNEVDEQLAERIVAMRGDIVVSRGQVHRLKQLPGFVAEANGDICGLILYRIAGGECEIVALNSYAENLGIGTRLIGLVKQKALECNCRRLWLITTNDNVKAIRFYQKRGFDMVRIHCDAVREARLLKPSIPLVSADGIPIRHEIEFEMLL